ncbi:MAG TPA: hypothetical protein VFJ16_17630 [Longimicrobium sp.]|nr:hypothetical protein [Longimicrobium sp.]
MSDKLSAASLLLAIVAVLYGMWYPQLVEALDTPVPEFPAERPKPRKAVEEIRRHRALPLLLAATGVAGVFLPDAVEIAIESLRILARKRIGAVRAYDSVATAFILVEVLSLYFVRHFLGVWSEFGKLIQRLSASA